LSRGPSLEVGCPTINAGKWEGHLTTKKTGIGNEKLRINYLDVTGGKKIRAGNILSQEGS